MKKLREDAQDRGAAAPDSVPQREGSEGEGGEPAALRGATWSVFLGPDRTDLAFSPGEVLSGRFEIVRLVARGGMGEVYEALDRELGAPIALKTIRAGLAGEAALKRFHREIQLARRVTHPNVCRIYDLFQHHPGTDAPPVSFLTMELLAGETLAERLKRAGPMRPEEALPLLQDMAEGLAAAHDAGVIHRDFKTANVVLVPSPDGGVRAVVTDFGVARSLQNEETSTITEPGRLVGTPAYMAPEQVEGAEVTPAADVYGLGVVMYEMVTGRRPFEGESGSEALRRLKQAAPSPRTEVPGLDRRWERVILRCLEREPSARFLDTRDVVRALAGEPVARGPRARRRIGIAAAVGLILALATAGLLSWRWMSGPSGARAPATSRPSVAVLGFRNASGRDDFAWLATALSEMLATELAAGEALRTIPGETVAQLKIEMSLAEADSYGADTLGRIRQNLGADYVAFGSFTAMGQASGSRLRVDLRLQDAREGSTLLSVAETGTEAELFDVVSRAGAQLRRRLGVQDVSAAEAAAVRASIPANPEAARLYADGLARLRVHDALGARTALESAAKLDPNFPLTHSALADAWASLGYDRKAEAEARLAFERSSGLSREARLLVEARLHAQTGEWGRAVEIYRTLWTFFPDNLEYGLRLAATQNDARRPKDALATIAALRLLPAPARDDPRVDLAETKAAGLVSDFERQRARAVTAARKAEAMGARGLQASAWTYEAMALRRLGDAQGALARLREAERLHGATGDRQGVASVLNTAASVHYTLGDYDAAQKAYAQALAINQEIGHRQGMATNFNNLANINSEQGDLPGAQRMYERALDAWREVGDTNSVAVALLNIAFILRQKGAIEDAMSRFSEALVAFREVEDGYGVALATNNIATLLFLQGDLPGARRSHDEALALARRISDESLAAHALYGLGEVLAAGDRLKEAEARHREAFVIRSRLGEKATAAESRIALARIALDGGRATEAEAEAREAAAALAAAKAAPAEAMARSALALGLAAQGKDDAAREALARAHALAQGGQDAAVRLSIAVASGRLGQRWGPEREAARRGLAAVEAEAVRLGFVGLALEARLAGLETLPAGMRAKMAQALEEEARQRGFALVAKKAARLASSDAGRR